MGQGYRADTLVVMATDITKHLSFLNQPRVALRTEQCEATNGDHRCTKVAGHRGTMHLDRRAEVAW